LAHGASGSTDCRRGAAMDRELLSQYQLHASKNEVHSAKVASLVRHGAAAYGAKTGRVAIDITAVGDRKRAMVDQNIAAHLRIFESSGAELIMGSGRFVASKTLEIQLNDSVGWSGTACSSTSARTRPFLAYPGSRPPAPDEHRGARARLSTAPSHCARRRLRGARVGPGLSALRQQRDRDRAWPAAHGPRGSRDLGGAAADSHGQGIQSLPAIWMRAPPIGYSARPEILLIEGSAIDR